jgi:hypothetical protein
MARLLASGEAQGLSGDQLLSDRFMATVNRTAESSRASRLCREPGTINKSPGNPSRSSARRPGGPGRVQHVDRCLAGILVLFQGSPGRQRDHCLTQVVLVTAVHRRCAASARRASRQLQLLTRQRAFGENFSASLLGRRKPHDHAP